MTRNVLPFRATSPTPAGRVRWARELPENVEPFRNLHSRGSTPAQKLGKKYEERVLRHLSGHFTSLRIAPWLQFDSGYTTRFCQPDAYLFDGTRLTIFEVKLTHTSYAVAQLRDLYAPVLTKLLAPKELRLVEIVKNIPDVLEDFCVYLDFAEFCDTQWRAECDAPVELLRWKL